MGRRYVTYSLLGLGILISLTGLVSFTRQVLQTRRAMSSEKWPVTRGVVLSSDVVGSSGSVNRWVPAVSYEYEVDGGSHENDVIAFHSLVGIHESGNRTQAKEIADLYPVGVSVDVHYDPQNPSVSVLKPGTALGNAIGLAFSGIWLLFGAAMVGLLAWARFAKDRDSTQDDDSRPTRK